MQKFRTINTVNGSRPIKEKNLLSCNYLNLVYLQLNLYNSASSKVEWDSITYFNQSLRLFEVGQTLLTLMGGLIVPALFFWRLFLQKKGSGGPKFIMNIQKIKKKYFFTVFWWRCRNFHPPTQAKSRSLPLFGLMYIVLVLIPLERKTEKLALVSKTKRSNNQKWIYDESMISFPITLNQRLFHFL